MFKQSVTICSGVLTGLLVKSAVSAVQTAVETQVENDLIETSHILILQLSQLRKMRDSHPVELTLPLVVGGFADALLPAGLTDLGSHFAFF